MTFGAIRMSGSLYFEYRPRGRPLWNVWLLTKITAQCIQQDDLTAKCAITKDTGWEQEKLKRPHGSPSRWAHGDGRSGVWSHQGLVRAETHMLCASPGRTNGFFILFIIIFLMLKA